MKLSHTHFVSSNTARPASLGAANGEFAPPTVVWFVENGTQPLYGPAIGA